MIVTLITVKLYAPWVHSLKEKRMVVKSICQKLKNKFNISILEKEYQDIHQTIVLAIGFLADNQGLADSIGENIIHFIQDNTQCDLLDTCWEDR